MRLIIVGRLLGILLALFSLALLPPILISLFFHDGESTHFIESMSIILVTGVLLWLPIRHAGNDLRHREVFLIVPLFWLILGMFAGLPFILGPHLSFTDSVFESVSAFTTTGATVMHGLDTMPKSILFYRQELQWLGGMGVVVLAIAILPMLGVGGMQMYQVETPGPMKNEKIAPRVSQGARLLWMIYIGVTLLCALALWAAGMTPFDAIAHSLSTVSTGGFSTHDQSIGYFNNPGIEALVTVFMLIGSINFGLHFAALRGKSPGRYWRDSEVRVYLGTILVLVTIISLGLISQDHQLNPLHALRVSLFQVVSVISSTGYTTENFAVWPVFLPMLLIISGFIGGCAGSTAGGMKVVRLMIVMKNGVRDIKRLMHPASVQVVRVADRVLPERLIQSVLAFFTTYIVVFVSLLLLVMATGIDLVTAWSAVATCLNNLGPGLGEVASSFATINPTAKWVLAFTMLAGRLEIFAVLLLFTPAFWRN